jgi:hypothetical protein
MVQRVSPSSLSRRILPICLVGFALAGCSSDLSRTFGLTRDSPDEFQVTTRAPLSMPPTYALRPPRPGAARPQEQSAQDAAASALSPSALLAPVGTASPGQDSLVQQAGPPAPANIRDQLDIDAAENAPSHGFVDSLMFWRSNAPPGVVLDPQREAQRLRDNAALGVSAQQGDTAIIQPKKGGWLSNLF